MKRLIVLTLLVAVLVLTAGTAASAAFLCPVVGDGVINAANTHGAEVSGDHGVVVIGPDVGTSILPGKEQAGANSNPMAHNPYGPNDPNASPPPGNGNYEWSPIWP